MSSFRHVIYHYRVSLTKKGRVYYFTNSYLCSPIDSHEAYTTVTKSIRKFVADTHEIHIDDVILENLSLLTP